MIGVLGLTIAFFAVTFLLLSLNLRSNWHWSVKVVAILLTSMLWVMTYFTVGDLSGRPAKQEFVPNNFTLLWSTEKEPDKKVHGDKGAIYLYVLDNKKRYRLFKVPYDYELHKNLVVAKKSICIGRSIIVETKKMEGDLTNTFIRKFMFYAMPDPTLPPKHQ